MKVYNYNSITNVYMGEEYASESPLEPGVYLLPANSTTVEPTIPPKDGYNIVWSGISWEYSLIEVEKEDPELELRKKTWEIEMLARSGLLMSDWVFQPDVSIQNMDEWIAYRAELRKIAINPTHDSIIPEKPPVIWS